MSHTARHIIHMVARSSNGICVSQPACLWTRDWRGEEGALTDDKACEATGWVIRTLLFSFLEAGWQGEGLSILGE